MKCILHLAQFQKLIIYVLQLVPKYETNVPVPYSSTHHELEVFVLIPTYYKFTSTHKYTNTFRVLRPMSEWSTE